MNIETKIRIGMVFVIFAIMFGGIYIAVNSYEPPPNPYKISLYNGTLSNITVDTGGVLNYPNTELFFADGYKITLGGVYAGISKGDQCELWYWSDEQTPGNDIMMTCNGTHIIPEW